MTVGAMVSTPKVKGVDVPILPAGSVWLAVMVLPVPCPMVVMLAVVRL